MADSANYSFEKVADTKLNICVVLSMLGKHDLAKEFARGAITNLEEAKT